MIRPQAVAITIDGSKVSGLLRAPQGAVKITEAYARLIDFSPSSVAAVQENCPRSGTECTPGTFALKRGFLLVS